jgi:Tripartite tricarboxylate transporter TctB family
LILQHFRMSSGIAAQNKRDRRLGVAVVIGVGATFAWRSLADLPLGTITEPGPAAAPLLLAGLLILSALWSLVSGTDGLLAAAEDDAGDGAGDAGGWQHAALIAAAAALAALCLDRIGYRLTILSLLLFFLWLVERKRIVLALLIGLGLSFGSFWLFDHILKVTLPIGPFGI